MSLPPETDFDDDPSEEMAAQWLVQRSEGFSAQQERAFKAWVAADPRHAAAVARLEQTCALLEKMPLVKPALVSDAPRPQSSPGALVRTPRSLWRRSTFRQIALAAAAVVVLGIAAWRQWQPRRPELSSPKHYATSSGHFERIDLADGSVLTLNSSSEAQVRFSERERRVILASGEAYFAVAPDAARPFVVEAAGVAMRAVGTAFNVRIAAETVELLVTEGKVRLDETTSPARPERPLPAGAAEDHAPLVQANQRALIATARAAAPVPLRVEELAETAVREAIAWQQRILVFNDTPLRDVAARFNQRNRIQLFIADDALAARRVGGTFAGDEVESFVRLLASDGSVVVERPGTHEIVLRLAR